jgi:hypothetical protein
MNEPNQSHLFSHYKGDKTTPTFCLHTIKCFQKIRSFGIQGWYWFWILNKTIWSQFSNKIRCWHKHNPDWTSGKWIHGCFNALKLVINWWLQYQTQINRLRWSAIARWRPSYSKTFIWRNLNSQLFPAKSWESSCSQLFQRYRKISSQG